MTLPQRLLKRILRVTISHTTNTSRDHFVCACITTLAFLMMQLVRAFGVCLCVYACQSLCLCTSERDRHRLWLRLYLNTNNDNPDTADFRHDEFLCVRACVRALGRCPSRICISLYSLIAFSCLLVQMCLLNSPHKKVMASGGERKPDKFFCAKFSHKMLVPAPTISLQQLRIKMI